MKAKSSSRGALWIGQGMDVYIYICKGKATETDQELCESRGGHRGLPSPNKPTVSVDVKLHFNRPKATEKRGRSRLDDRQTGGVVNGGVVEVGHAEDGAGCAAVGPGARPAPVSLLQADGPGGQDVQRAVPHRSFGLGR